VVAARLFDPSAGRQVVDRYELIGELASGGMATVYLARITGVGGFQRFVALKRLHPHLALDTEFVEMFLDEARLAASIHHNNVVPILEVNSNHAIGYYLVMEYIEGDTLARVLARAANKGQRIPIAITLRMALDLLSGLHAAHELRDGAGEALNLVHRDVSPQNVLVGFDGIARITDFGVARAASRLSATRVGQLKGKVAYMAPEQAQGADDVDRRADVFSAGVVIWEALAARRLFKAENEASTLARVLATAVPALQLMSSEITPELSAAVMKALERDPDARYATAAEFADAIEAAARGPLRVATPRELGAYIEALLGDENEAQREAVRAWLARNEPSPISQRTIAGPVSVGTSSVSAASFTVNDQDSQSGARRAAPRRSRVFTVLGLAALFGAVGAGAFYGTNALTGAPAAPVGIATPTLQAPVPAAPPAAAAPPAPAPTPEPAAVAAPAPASSSELTAAATEPGASRGRPAARSGGAVPRSSRRKKSSEAVPPENPYR
jgi:serine/threonine-protein kinase